MQNVVLLTHRWSERTSPSPETDCLSRHNVFTVDQPTALLSEFQARKRVPLLLPCATGMKSRKEHGFLSALYAATKTVATRASVLFDARDQ